MKKIILAGLFLLTTSVILLSLNNPPENISSEETAAITAPEEQTMLKAFSSEDMLIIQYDLQHAENSYLIISDMNGKNLKVVKLEKAEGKISLSKSELDKAGGNGLYTCTLQVNGAQVLSRQAATFNS
jgi:hypothetical protein